MKCPKCGQEIPNDSVFCEYCGTQIKTINEPSHSSGTTWKIVLGIVLLFLIAILIREFHALSDAKVEVQDLKTQVGNMKYVNNTQKEKLKSLTKYSLTAGSQQKITNSFDSEWILWLNANERVYLESFEVRPPSKGSVEIGIYKENDYLVKKININLPNDKFNKVEANITLEKGKYYMRICSGKNLQYHPSSNQEYEKYAGGLLEVTGACHYNNRKQTDAYQRHDYYQYFYNFKYHIVYDD